MGESLIAKDMKDSDQPDLLRRTVESDLRDRYTIESVLGFGRAARVYRAREKATGRPAALKVVPLPQRRHFAAAELFHRFERDAARTAALRFSHLVPIRAYGSAATYLWYEMDYVEAPSLAQQLESAGILELDPCLAIIDQMASALDYMHRRGVTHGNLRPTHIFVDAERWARLSDFNISRALEDLLPPDSHHDPLRVLQYVAPEQFDTRLGSPSADQYALAVVAYECLTGEPPFQADSPIGLEQLHQIAAPRPLHEIRSEIPQHVDYAIRRALSKTPHTRFANVIDFASMLHGGSWGPQHAQLAAPADVPLHAPRVLMGDPSPQRLEKLNRALSALPALASQLTRMGREALRRAPAPQPIITRQPTIPAPTSSLRPRSIEEAPQPPTPKIEESGTAPPIQPTEAPPVIEVRDAPPVVEAAPAPPVIEARDEPPVVEAAPAPPVIDITEPAGEEIKSDEQIATGREAAAAQGFAPVLPDEESEEVEPTVAEPAVEAEETGVAAVASGDNAIRQPGSPASQRPVWPAFEPAESPVFQHAGAKRRQSPLQVAPATAVETERGKISVVPRWRASLGRMAASLRRSAAGVSEALARIEVAPILAALGAFWRSLIRLLLWIWRVLVRLAGFIAAEMGKLSATIAEASRRAWAAAKPVLKRATGATGRVLGHWSRIAGAALLRLSKAAARALGRGSRVAGAALLRLSKAAARALGRGSRVAGAALLRLSKAAARALGRGSRVAGAALLRLSKAGARALGRGSRVAGAALLRLSKAAALALGRGSRVAGAALLRLSKAAALALGRGSRSAGLALLRVSGPSGQSVLRFANRVAPATSKWFAAAGRLLRSGWRSIAQLWAMARAGAARVAVAWSSLAGSLHALWRSSAQFVGSVAGGLRRLAGAIGYWYGGIRGKIWLYRLKARMRARQREGRAPKRLASLAEWPLQSYAITAAAAVVLIWAGALLLRSSPEEQAAVTRESVVAAPAQSEPEPTVQAPLPSDEAGAPAGSSAAPPQPSDRASQEPSQVAQQPAAAAPVASRTMPPPASDRPSRELSQTAPQPATQEVTPPAARSPADQEAPATTPTSAAPAEPARLFINSRPWGAVFIDGELIGNTPQLNVQVTAGTHVIRVEREGRRPFERQIRVGAGEELRITDIELQEQQ